MPDKPFPSSEYKLLAELSQVLGPFALPGGAYPLTLGDDAAVRRAIRGGEETVITTDTAVENVHFKTECMTFQEIGFRIMAANVSDCAAMAARPEAALVNLVFPPLENELLTRNAVELYKGFAGACEKWNFRVIGGDLAGGSNWTISITMIGRVPRKGRIITRKGIREGDRLWAAAFPGQSAAGLAALKKWAREDIPEQYNRLVMRHVSPKPDVDQSVRFGECLEIHAMMDLSDGISKDARTLCYENELGLNIDMTALLPPADMVALAHALGDKPADWILHGGEEYVLLFAAAPDFYPVRTFLDTQITPVGRFTSKHRTIMALGGGDSVEEVGVGGWDHLSG